MSIRWTKEEARAFSANAKRLRQEQGLTQDELAEKAGITRQSYNNLETEPERDISIGTALSIAHVLGSTVEVMVQP